MKKLKRKGKNMSEDIIASRGFTNSNRHEFSFFVEIMKDNTLVLHINHINDNGEFVISPKISPQVLSELKVMCEAALAQIEKFSLDSDSFRNY